MFSLRISVSKKDLPIRQVLCAFCEYKLHTTLTLSVDRGNDVCVVGEFASFCFLLSFFT